MLKFEPELNTAYFIQSRVNALVIDVNRAAANRGEKVHQWECHGGKNQQWYFEKDGEGFYNIRNVNSLLYLQFGQDGKLIQEGKSNQDNQRFAFSVSKENNIVIRTKANGKAITVPWTDLKTKTKQDSRQGTQFIEWDPLNQLNQDFYICKSIPEKLELVEVECIKPASGTFLAGWNIASIATTIGGGGVGVVGAGLAVAGVATGGTALAVVGAGIGVAGIGTTLVGVVDGFTAGNDDLYIEVNKTKIWPQGKKYGSVGKGDVLKMNTILSERWSSTDTIQLWEYDMVSSDDALTEKITINPIKALWNSQFTVVTGSDSEGSLYALTFLLS